MIGGLVDTAAQEHTEKIVATILSALPNVTAGRAAEVPCQMTKHLTLINRRF